MEINQDLINKLAKLARLEFDESAQEAIQSDLKQMIAFVEKINELDTSQLEPLMHMAEQNNVFRTDKVRQLNSKEAALKNAPLKNEDFVKVLKVLKK